MTEEVDYTNELGLIEGEELPPIPVGDLPEAGDFSLLQPGRYNFVLPSKELLLSGVKAFQTALGQRVEVKFGRARTASGEPGPNSSLKVPALGNKQVEAKVNNLERRQGDVLVSDFAHLLQALGVQEVFNTNKAYVDSLLDKAEGTFSANFTWSSRCNPKADIYGPEGKKVEGKKGCGQEYALAAFEYKRGNKAGQKVLAIPQKEDGTYAERFACTCGAFLRAFGNLRDFKPASK